MRKIIYNNWIIFKIYFKLDYKFVIINTLSSICQIVQPLSSIYLFKLFLDSVFIDKSFAKSINIICIVILINLIAQIIYTILNNKIAPISNQRVNSKVVAQILNKYLEVDMKNISDKEFYDKYTQVLNDLPQRVISMQDNISKFLGNILSISTIITLMFSLDSFMIIISFISIIANLCISPILKKIGYEKYLEKTSYERKQSYIKRIFYLYDYAKELKLYNINNVLMDEFEKSNSNLIDVINKYSVKNIFFILIMGLINLASFAAILIYLAYYALREVFTIGDVSALYNATEQLKSSIIEFLSLIPTFIENSLYVENYTSFMKVSSTIETSKGELIDDFRSITYRDVSFSYYNNNEKLVLKNINLSIHKNTKIALVGNNGAGKSTFINLLLRIFDCTNGEIYFNKINYKDIDINSLREKFFIIPQDSQQYALTIAENILLRKINCKEDEELVFSVLKKVDLFDKVMNLKNGINTILTNEFDNGIILSGGELQKLFVARVLACNAPIIVLDEVTSNMDALSENKIFDQIEKYVSNKTIIYISHKLSMTKRADKIYLFDNGKIIEEGNHESLMAYNGLYKKMFTAQAEQYGDNNG